MRRPDDLPARLREARQDLGLTQAALAARAGVSLATVQNVEAGRANPSLATLRKVLAPLALDFGVRPQSVDWDVLAGIGVPLSRSRRAARGVDPAGLPGLVRRAARELAAGGGASAGVERKREALQAYLLALRLHFPTTWRRVRHGRPEVGRMLPSRPSGRVIKLARVAVRRLAEVV